ncbi:hypothetical protein [Bacillus marinisedimentorum]|uniref:hypothetical protein n=1 Tax=Bacillus marinisedimentorum TaxID=1821260 RepID=UPI0007E21BD0|nr:hypothetical protein [Bacillus marinisedimentorum]
MSIIVIEGNVEYKITLDPGVWIFDDRKVEMDQAFANKSSSRNEEDDDRSIARQWDRETRVDAVEPPVEMSTDKFKKEKLLDGTYAMVLEPFLDNAGPREGSKSLIIETRDGQETAVPITDAFGLILAFSEDGKPLREDGPVHIYFADGSNRHNPIKNAVKLIVK